MTRIEALKKAEEQLRMAENAATSSLLSMREKAAARIDIARGYIALARELDKS